MIAAIYSRKSNEQNNGVADEAKSVARQIEHAKIYAAKKGWQVLDEHVYVDDGISGAVFGGRPGFVALMTAIAVKPKPKFQALIMSEESRLGREQIEVSYALKQIVTSGVRVFCYMGDTERTLNSPIEKIMLNLQTMADEMEREKARHRSRDAALQRARHGYVTGGKCFGYRQHRTDAGHVVREIDPVEADVVRRIFTLAAAGKGKARIAQVLNREHAPAPRAQQGRPNGWVPSSVRAIVYRPIYKGEVVWGRAMKRDTWGQVKATKRPESEWTRTDAPHLRIVSDELWDAAHERMATSRLNYWRCQDDGRLLSKPANGVESKYLLTGMATCGTCGGSMTVYSRSHGRQRAYFYACPRSKVDLCANTLEAPMPLADQTALGMMSDDVLAPDVVTLALDKLMAKFDQPVEDVDATRKRLTTALGIVEKELATLLQHVVAGDTPDTVMGAIRDRERAQKGLLVELKALDERPAVVAAAPERAAPRVERGIRDALLPKIGSDVKAMRSVLDSLDREHGFTRIYRGMTATGVGGWADRRQRRAVGPHLASADDFAVHLHETGHLLSRECQPGRDGHQPNPAVRAWWHCLRCEHLAWAAAMSIAPFNREMFAHLRSSLAIYRRSTPAPRHRGHGHAQHASHVARGSSATALREAARGSSAWCGGGYQAV